jgi:hypothetical protein
MKGIYLYILKKDNVTKLNNDLLRIMFVQSKTKYKVIPALNELNITAWIRRGSGG